MRMTKTYSLHQSLMMMTSNTRSTDKILEKFKSSNRITFSPRNIAFHYSKVTFIKKSLMKSINNLRKHVPWLVRFFKTTLSLPTWLYLRFVMTLSCLIVGIKLLNGWLILLWKHNMQTFFIIFFYQPVDPDACGIPDYLDIIKNPMDFGTIRQRLN